MNFIYHFQFNHAKMYQYNQPGFNQCPPGFQAQASGSGASATPTTAAQWQFNGFPQEGFQPPNYNYGNNFNQASSQWNQQHWNNSWSYYNNGQQPSSASAAVGSAGSAGSAEPLVSASYQRTLEYVQQCQQQQQQSWSANTTNNPQ